MSIWRGPVFTLNEAISNSYCPFAWDGSKQTESEGTVQRQGQFTSIILFFTVPCLPCLIVAVNLTLNSAEITISEGANLVNVNITKDGMTTVDTRVILSTLQNGTAVGRSLFIFSEFDF